MIHFLLYAILFIAGCITGLLVRSENGKIKEIEEHISLFQQSAMRVKVKKDFEVLIEKIKSVL